MIVELSDANYSDFITGTGKPVFIDFYSPTCGPCQAVLAYLPRLDEYFGEEAVIAKVDVSRNPKLASKYEIRSVPFCVSIGARDKMVKDYEMGAASMERYIGMVQKAQGKGFWARLLGR